MPRGSSALIDKRKNEILDACEKIYSEQGFYGVNIKAISTQVSLSRPAIYNYFETKEEILLGLLMREYDAWCGDLEHLISCAAQLDREKLSNAIAETLEDKNVLLRIISMNLFEIEQNSRIERLADFKKRYLRSVTALQNILHAYDGNIKAEERTIFTQSFCAYMFGIYPFTHHSEKQKEAMMRAGVELREPTIKEMLFTCLIKLLP